MQMAIRACELVGQVAGQRAAFGQEAMFADDRTHAQDRTGAGEAGLGIAIARDMQMDAMRPGRQAGKIELDQKPAIHRQEIHGADRLAVQVFQMRDGARLGASGKRQRPARPCPMPGKNRSCASLSLPPAKAKEKREPNGPGRVGQKPKGNRRFDPCAFPASPLPCPHNRPPAFLTASD